MRLVSRAVLLALSAAASGLPVASAGAQQESFSQQFEDIRSSVGLGKSRQPIDFTERPPIVVPPTDTLPPPGTADADRLSVNDPDVATRRKAMSDMRRPVPPTDPGAIATGRDSRTYLIDPPSGMRDPDAVEADITHDTSGTAAGPKHARVRKKKVSAAAQ